MPVKLRIAKQRRPAFSDEALLLFRQLESVPPSLRKDNPEFRAADLALHDAIGLEFERRCIMCSVLDRGVAPPWPPDMPSHHAWHRVHAVRRALLEAVKESRAGLHVASAV